LSALREQELPALIGALPSLDLSGFTHISIHAPSRFEQISEMGAAKLLETAVGRGIGIVVHPDTIIDSEVWKKFGALLWIENLDKRKPIGRTAADLGTLFEEFPNAGFCLDVAHARQIDPTMSEAATMLIRFKERIRQIHASGLNANSTHSALSVAARSAFSQISHLIPNDIPIILESPVAESAIRDELDYAKSAFSPWLHLLESDIDDVLHFRAPSLRRTQLEAFLRILHNTGTKLRDFPQVVCQLPTGGFYKPGDFFSNTSTLLNRLSPGDVESLKYHLYNRVSEAAAEFPDLAEAFKEQFM